MAIRATEIVREVAGSEKATNMVALGALFANENTLSPEVLEPVFRRELDPRKANLLKRNIEAFRAGMQAAETVRAQA